MFLKRLRLLLRAVGKLNYDNFENTTKWFVCNGVKSSCQSYITFRSMTPYDSLSLTAKLSGVPQAATLIASINHISSENASIPTTSQVVVPVHCSCYARQYYQHNVNYTLKHGYETSRWPTSGGATMEIKGASAPLIFFFKYFLY